MSNHNSNIDNINSAGDNNVTDSNSRANILAAVSILQFSLFTISIQHYTENKVLTNEISQKYLNFCRIFEYIHMQHKRSALQTKEQE